MYIVPNDMSPDIMNGVFKLRNTPHYNLRHASHLRPKISEQIPTEIKNKDSFDGFEKEIKKWKTTWCQCRIFKTFLSNLSFV